MRVLIVSHTFPPDSAVGGLRIARLCRYLPECDVHPFVLTVEDRLYESVDRSVFLPSDLKVIRTRSLSTPLDWYRRLIQHRRSRPGDVGIAQGRGPNSSLARQHLLAMSKKSGSLIERMRQNPCLALQARSILGWITF